MKSIDRTPRPLSSGAGLVAAVLAVVAISPYAPTGVMIGVAGLGLLLVGLVRANRTGATIGSLALFAGSIVAGAGNAPVAVTLFAIVVSVLAYDFTTTGIDLGDQLGREADTRRLELVRIGLTTAVGVVAGTSGYAVFLLGTGGQPVSVLAVLLLAVVILLLALRREPLKSSRR